MIPTLPETGTLTFRGRAPEIGRVLGFDDKNGGGRLEEGAGVRVELDDGPGEA